ncbi:Por secretion system C-terminal sorting domain-containing protein [Ekhidna lutea]|uniref:Por secretion system C-terminal sorting domain-containing protein n=1 Tax=Ekhidna lutea TaxID=447679 RepID=A0A239M8F1_EKHLU|nr:T9SS type A sorting domain-containing protein [Ekhidna lutea]SNT38334.1 Por secretion system C-terminal sorting domain-containing protein [Ekhidna lutea]
MRKTKLHLTLFILVLSFHSFSQEHSVARKWNEVLLEAIRNDFARPTVHARNLFHVSAAMYDAWSMYDKTAVPFLFNRYIKSYKQDLQFSHNEENIEEARVEAISYAAYNLIVHRFSFSPGTQKTFTAANELMAELGYETSFTSTDFSEGNPAALGNFIAQSYIEFGLIDGSNEEQDYINKHYQPVNPPLVPTDPGNSVIIDLNRWQPLFFDEFIDQAGNPETEGVIDFLSPEWGSVIPFSLQSSDRTIYERDENEYWVYHDPGPPPYIEEDGSGMSDEYKWGFSMVSIWGAHLAEEELIDISPANFGNNDSFPTAFENYDSFYKYLEGGDIGTGHDKNPFTDAPYEPNMVPKGDYTRVLAEFWADGPDSETPPGHWFTILNYVMDHELFERRFGGEGEIISELEYDLKAYFTLGGAMHDCAITAWGIKGWYDYIRPISSIRAMAELGQSSDETLDNYHVNGIPLVDNYIEVVEEGDPLAGAENEHVGKIKVYSWRGHDFITDPDTDIAGVGWILAENWWPYQRPTFVTPPFAGYVSGHSTFSRAAAEVLTLLTGDPYFPGGIGEFLAPQNEFLVFEEGPSVDVTLQWATYRDASDQTSLSRIWGGIHPPADDVPGRIIGEEIGVDAFEYAQNFFNGIVPLSVDKESMYRLYPNPVAINGTITIDAKEKGTFLLYNLNGTLLHIEEIGAATNQISLSGLQHGLYIYKIDGSINRSGRLIVR